MSYPDQLCEECPIEKYIEGVNSVEHAKRGIRLCLGSLVSLDEVQSDFDVPQQKQALKDCCEVNISNSARGPCSNLAQ